jgi:hypothetical protein
VHDGGEVPGIQLSTLTGNQVIVRDLEEAWAAAQRLTGHVVDPLDARYLNDANEGG